MYHTPYNNGIIASLYEYMNMAAFQITPVDKRHNKIVSLVLLSRSDDDDCDQLPQQRIHSLSPVGGRRRSFLSVMMGTIITSTSSSINTSPSNLLLLPPRANAAETVGKDEACNDSSCLGVWDGLLADCPHGNKNKLSKTGCVSSQDDTPGIFAEPWDYSDNIPLSSSSISIDDAYKEEMNKLILAIQTTSKDHGDKADVQYQEGRYLRVLFIDGTSKEESIGEFYYTPNDSTVQFRIGSSRRRAANTTLSSAPSISLLGKGRLTNNERSECIRKSLQYLKVPVLRNRKRTFFFVESDALDAFGPGSAMLGPPEEMTPGELGDGAGGGRGRTPPQRGSDNVDPNLKIDLVESFPYSK